MKKRIKIKYIVLAVLIAAVVLYAAAELYNGRWFSNESGADLQTFLATGVSVSYEKSSGASFYTFGGGKGFYFATKDGIQFVSDDGRTLMSESFTMQNPQLYGEGQIAAITELSGYSAYVFNPQGLMYSKQFENPIVNFSVNTLGYSCVVTKKTGEYEAYVYNASGALVSTGIFPETNIMVTSADISNDGRIWAVAFLDISGAQISSKITFAFLNKSESAGYIDNIFATINDEKNRYFGMVKFMDGNNLIVVTDRDIFCVNPSSGSMKTKWTLELGNEIDKISFEKDYIAVAFGKGLLNMPSEPIGRAVILDLDMNRLAEFDAGERVTSLSAFAQGNSRAMLVGCGRSYYAINGKGTLLWACDAAYDTRVMYFMDLSGKALTQTGTEARVLKLTKVSAGNIAPEPSPDIEE